jgi:transposase
MRAPERRISGGRPNSSQHHTSKRIFERLREMFVPSRHDPGHAQVDFGEALAVIGGVEQKLHFFAMDLPHNDVCVMQAYPAETTEAFSDGHNVGFEFFGGVPHSILYDNTKLAVARILGDGTRRRTKVFSELQLNYLFADRFGRPGNGNDKGEVEGLVGYARRNFMVPIPRATSFAELNAQLLECCRRRWSDRLRSHAETIGERLVRDRGALLPLPARLHAPELKEPNRRRRRDYALRCSEKIA